ncbi:hypothetical protein [Wolbachia endosymbiont of Oedothorax gibbosus]|uniref:hypothetical protein n=1 Tax=Wolbachia endosymbiont of Oedothorax gibbosus TaxID=931100 RepID=UPI002024A4BC|nr:hypothetical protein [Wolbachia endosymbiont of Oedothorax gibbosus]
MKKNIKSELEKDLKCEFDDKTKNELKKNIKSELEKDLKCEFDDKTKNELKDKIKKEIKDEIDCKCDQDKTSDEEKDKDKDEIVDDGSEGAIESKLIDEGLKVNCPDYKSDSMNKPGWFTRDLLKQFLPDLMISKKITDHFGEKNVEQYYAENFAITFKCEEDAKCGSNVNFTWDIASNMWCNKEGKQGNAWELCPKDFLKGETSVCCPSGSKASAYAENFFLNNKCPNLILDLKGKELEECAGKTIVAKLESPLIITDYYKNIIDKNGNKIGINYNQLKPHLNPDGTMKDCGNNTDCQKYAKIIDTILWTSDKEVTLKIPDNAGESNFYSPSVGNNQDETFSYHDYSNDLI